MSAHACWLARASEIKDERGGSHFAHTDAGRNSMVWRLMVAGVLVSVMGACSGNNATVTTPSSGSPGGPTITMVSGASGLTTTAYSPNPQTITRGSTVTFINNDGTSHTATSGGVFDTGLIAPGGRVSVTLQNAGSITYRCSLHPNMTGTITVQ
jgi:plastocyanin